MQYDKIVSLATWDREEQLALDVPVPLEDPVYAPIRKDISAPMTVCGILEKMEDKYGIGVGIGQRGHACGAQNVWGGCWGIMSSGMNGCGG